MSHNSKNNQSSITTNPKLKIITASIALAGLAYGSYKYLFGNKTIGIKNENLIITDNNINNNLKFKQNKNTTISLVITKSVLNLIDNYNELNEDGIDIQSYLNFYPNLVIILYPELNLNDIESYFEINENFKNRILQTSIEESIFHLLKQLKNDINLLNLNDFKISKEKIESQFRLNNILSNVIDLDNNLFTNYI
jgi:hypothetical protein